MWKKLSLLSVTTKLIASLCLSFPVFIPVSHFRASKSCSRGEHGKRFTILSWTGFVSILCVHCLDSAFVGRPSLKFEKPAFTPPSLCEGRFAGPLQYRVWKSMKGSIYPGTSIGPISLCKCHLQTLNYTETNTDNLSMNTLLKNLVNLLLSYNFPVFSSSSHHI